MGVRNMYAPLVNAFVEAVLPNLSAVAGTLRCLEHEYQCTVVAEVKQLYHSDGSIVLSFLHIKFTDN